MGKLQISDLVDPKCIEELKALDAELTTLKNDYVDVCAKLSNALSIKVSGLDDLEKMNKIINEASAKTVETTKKINETIQQRNKKVEEASKAMKDNVSELEKVTKKKKEEIKIDKEALAIARSILGSRDKNLKELVRLEKAIADNAKAQKDLTEAEKNGAINTEKAVTSRANLIGKERELKTAKRELQKTLAIEEKMSNSAAGGYSEAAQQLELLKRAYKQLDSEAKSSQVGERLADEITKLDEALKGSAAKMGEHQRNVGDYAIANKSKLSEMLGITDNVGASFLNMAQKGELGFSALTSKASAFFKTLIGFLANPAVLAVLGIGGTVVAFKWLYDYNKGLAEATKKTQQFTGASGAMLQNQRNSLQAMADQYGKDFQDVLMSVNAVAQQFGITFEEAFEKVNIGFASGADANEEFLDNLKEYPAYFKEAGLSASEFIAITTQTNKMGIYSDKALDTVKEANIRIREMNDATRKALEGIGISSDKVQADLESGSKTTFDILQEVSAKLAEFPESSEEVGAALADIFGGPGEDAGLQYIKLLKDIDLDLDRVKEKSGKMAELNLKQFKAQLALQNSIDALFDFTGGSFEELTAKANIFVKDGLRRIINGIIKVSNYFIKLYNDSEGFRNLWQSIILGYKDGFDYIANSFVWFKESIKGIGEMLRGAFTLDWDLMRKGLADFAKSYKKLAITQIEDMKKNREERKEAIKNGGNLKLLEVPGTKKGNEDKNKDDEEKGKNKAKNKKKALKEIADEAKETQKITEALRQSEIDLMDEGYNKALALMEDNHKKRLAEIKGNSAEENELRKNLEQAFLKKVADYKEAYETERMKLDISNRLETVEEGSEEELKLRLQLLDIEKDAELKAAEQSGADKVAIEERYSRKRLEVEEDLSRKRLAIIEEEYSARAIIASVNLTNEVNELKKAYADGLISKEEYEAKKAEISQRYAFDETKSTIDMLEKQLAQENLSAEDREKIELELAKAKASLEGDMSDAMIEETQRQNAADKKLADEREARLRQYVGVAKEAFNTISDMMQTKYENDIQKLEEQSEANEESYQKEIERIEDLEGKGAISKEEAEQRKRAAEEKTRAKEKEILKEKQKLQHKQAIWNKANQVAQSVINTARAVTEALPNVVLAGIIGALGAIQTATIIATPIPAYAKGTDNHKGGLAVVGDGGKSEVVLIDGKAWVTPDIPTLVDLPKGAEVLPDIQKMDLGSDLFSGMNALIQDAPIVNVNSDNSDVVKSIKDLSYLIKKQTTQQRDIANRQEFDRYIDEHM